MKKRLTILIAIMLLLISVTVCFVGCAPSRPDKFVERILASNNWGVAIYNKNGVRTIHEARNGNLRYSYGSVSERYILVGKTIVESFIYKDKNWSYEATTDAENVEELRNIVLQSTPNNVTNDNGLDLKYITTNFLEKFEKKNGKWYERNTQPACLYVKGNNLYYIKNDVQVVLSIGYNLSLPKEALQVRPGTEVE